MRTERSAAPRVARAHATRRAVAEKNGAQRAPALATPERAPPSAIVAPRAAVVKSALVADNAYVRANDPAGFAEKLSRLSASPFVFFRGTAGLFYRDLAGSDANMPRVLLNGDPHPENFAVMGPSPKRLSFGLDDFDEAIRGPFSWDVKRAVSGFALLAKERGVDEAGRSGVARAFARGYLAAMREFSGDGSERRAQLTARKPPALLEELFGKQAAKERRKLIAKYAEAGRFKADDQLVPVSARVGELQALVDRYRARLDKGAPDDEDHYRVKDVAERKGSGTASLGLKRYWILLEGRSSAPGDDVILELKEARPSALEPYLEGRPHQLRHKRATPAERVARAHAVQRGADPYYGAMLLDGRSFVVRERSPYAAKADIASMDARAFRQLAKLCGRALAHAHARDDGKKDRVEKRILAAAGDRFADDMAAFAMATTRKIEADHAAYLVMRERGEL